MIKVLNAIRPFPLNELDQLHHSRTVWPGKIHGEPVLGYKEEKEVVETSQAETFVAAKLFYRQRTLERSAFYMRGGKRLPIQMTEVVITFQK